MAGASIVTLFRSEDATIDFTIEKRDAARVQLADLRFANVLRLKIREYPITDALVLEMIASDTVFVQGCSLQIVDIGIARLRIPEVFWVTHTAPKYTIELWLETVSTVDRVGYVIIEVAGTVA